MMQERDPGHHDIHGQDNKQKGGGAGAGGSGMSASGGGPSSHGRHGRAVETSTPAGRAISPDGGKDRGVAGRPPTDRAVTWRAVLMGLVWVALVSGIAPYNDHVLGNTFLIGSNLPLAAIVPLFVVVAAVNPLLALVRRGWALSSGELAVLFAVVLVGCAVPGSGLMRYWPGSLAGPLQLAREGGDRLALIGWLDLPSWIWPDLPGTTARERSLSPVIGALYSRWMADSNPAWAWVVPVLAWGVFLGALATALLCMAVIFRRQWVENERLAFPLAQIPLALIEPPADGSAWNATLRRRGFWVALSAVFTLHLWNGLARYLPDRVPVIPVYYDLWNLMSEPPLSYASYKLKDAAVFFSVVGVTFFVTTRVAMSLWAFFLLSQVYRMVSGSATGVPAVAGMGDQHAGAVLAFAAATVWIARRHLGQVILAAIGRGSLRSRALADASPTPATARASTTSASTTSPPTTSAPTAPASTAPTSTAPASTISAPTAPQRPSASLQLASSPFQLASTASVSPRYLGYGPAAWGLIASVAIMIGWLVLAGVSFLAATVCVGLLLVLFLVITRVVAETGLLYGQLLFPLFRPWQWLASAGWPRAVSGESFFLTAVVNAHHFDFREPLPVYAVHGLRVTDETAMAAGRGARRASQWRGLAIVGAMGLALMVAYGVSVSSTLWVQYNHAVTRTDPPLTPVNRWGMEIVPEYQIVGPTLAHEAGVYRAAGASSAYNPMLHLGIGAGLTGGLWWLTLRYAWWPLHPVGYLMLGTYPSDHLWLSVLVGWACKVLILRFGGAKAYTWARPVFMGLIVGESLAAMGWLVVALVMTGMGWGYRAVNVLPG